MKDSYSKNKERPSGRLREKRKWYNYLLWGDYLLYAAIVVLSVALFLSMPLLRRGEAAAAVITVDMELVREIPLEDLAGHGNFELEANGFHYLFIYEDGKIRFTEADCPDLICVRTSWISRTGDIAACVPGRVILRITGKEANGINETDDVDVIVR